jgi:hypothetical protein
MLLSNLSCVGENCLASVDENYGKSKNSTIVGDLQKYISLTQDELLDLIICL